jgi:isoleucyl-tRNA synthetase
VNHFCVVDLSAFYFDVLKDRLYTFTPNSPGRRSAQTAMWKIAEALVRLLAPITSFTSEEIWQYLPAVSGREESVHLTSFPSAAEILGEEVPTDADEKFARDWTTLRSVRDEVLKKLEEARANNLIGGGLEARVHLRAADPVYSVLSRYADQLRYLFIVSAVSLSPVTGNGSSGVHVEVRKADGKKCERCWNYSTHVGEDPVYPMLCERCSPRVKEIEAG